MLRRFCHAVAVQIYNLTVLLDVEKVAIGGGISKQPLLLESLRSAYDGLYASRAGQAYMEGLPRCQIVPCAFSSEANQVGVAAAYFEAMQKKMLISSRFHGTISAVCSARKTRNKEILNHEHSA